MGRSVFRSKQTMKCLYVYEKMKQSHSKMFAFIYGTTPFDKEFILNIFFPLNLIKNNTLGKLINLLLAADISQSFVNIWKATLTQEVEWSWNKKSPGFSQQFKFPPKEKELIIWPSLYNCARLLYFLPSHGILASNLFLIHLMLWHCNFYTIAQKYLIFIFIFCSSNIFFLFYFSDDVDDDEGRGIRRTYRQTLNR